MLVNVDRMFQSVVRGWVREEFGGLTVCLDVGEGSRWRRLGMFESPILGGSGRRFGKEKKVQC